MKANIIKEDSNPIFLYSMEIMGIFCTMTFIFLLRYYYRTSIPDYGKIVSFFKDIPGIEAEDAGETRSNYLFNITISAAKQHFDLNKFVKTMQDMKCSVLSTVDTNNPSFRTLTVQVPKSRKSAGIILFLFLGIFVGIVFIWFTQRENLYIVLPLESFKKYVR